MFGHPFVAMLIVLTIVRALYISLKKETREAMVQMPFAVFFLQVFYIGEHLFYMFIAFKLAGL